MGVYWSQEQIDRQTQYFAKERTEKKGNFTELVVRLYYCIYKACSLNDRISFDSKDVAFYKVKDILYEGFYDTGSSHRGVIDDCMKHLKLMHYIRFRKVEDKWMICLNRPLDFLLEGEHEAYLEKYGIVETVYFLAVS